VTPPILTLTIASKHEAKIAELKKLLSGLRIRFVTLAELGITEGLDEDATLEASAMRKAREACKETGMIALAEESGLEVDALGGRPGVRSAHFAHERATDAENNAALLRALEEVDEGYRHARFRSVLALASPWSDDIIVEQGQCQGRIARAPRGGGGFGYDPLFVVEGSEDKSLAELDVAELSRVSPRVVAVGALRTRLAEVLTALVSDVDRIAT
jgi:XTP/dITP diphosphohydrolase